MWWCEKTLWVGRRVDALSGKAFALPTGTWTRSLALPLGLMLLASCGFHLRGDADYPFDTIFVNAPSSPPLSMELTRALNAAGKAKVVASASGAEVALDVPSVVDDKEVLSLSSGGSVREYQLVKRVAFRLHDKNGIDWMACRRNRDPPLVHVQRDAGARTRPAGAALAARHADRCRPAARASAAGGKTTSVNFVRHASRGGKFSLDEVCAKSFGRPRAFRVEKARSAPIISALRAPFSCAPMPAEWLR